MLRLNAKRAQDDNTRKSSNFEVNMSEQEILLIEPIDCTEEIIVNKLFQQWIFTEPSLWKIPTLRAMLIH